MPLSGYGILLVEDEALIALDLSRVLQQLHAIVAGLVNNVAAARKLVSEAPDRGGVMTASGTNLRRMVRHSFCRSRPA
jgi:hypothetical protein